MPQFDALARAGAALLGEPLAVQALGLLALVATSGKVLGFVLGTVLEEDPFDEMDQSQRDTGTVIGKCENVIVYVFVLVGAFTALGLVFAAKSLVRKEDIDSDDTSYYLTGTLVNFTYSILVGLLFRTLVLG
ncbi:hypothetical protein ACFQH6_01055 [Halobacteriaceae archaeon GCM10025711]